MHVLRRLPYRAAVVLLAAPWVAAETPLTDPIPPAVIGRPLHRIQPVPPPPAATQAPPARPTIPKRAPTATKPDRPPKPAAGSQAVASPRAPKPAVDDRADPRARMADDVGKGSRVASQPLKEGAYIGARHQALVRQYYQANPASGKAATWKIGEPVPRKAAVADVPDDLRAQLPVVPPGHRYAQIDGEVVLFAVKSRMVVDGVSRNVR